MRVKLCQGDHYGDARGWHGPASAALALALRSGTPAGPVGTDAGELARRCANFSPSPSIALAFYLPFSCVESDLEVNSLVLNSNHVFKQFLSVVSFNLPFCTIY